MGGLAEYLEIDPNILRLGLIFLMALGLVLDTGLTVALIITYVLAWLFIPEEAEGKPREGLLEAELKRGDLRWVAGVLIMVLGLMAAVVGLSLILTPLSQLLVRFMEYMGTGVLGLVILIIGIIVMLAGYKMTKGKTGSREDSES